MKTVFESFKVKFFLLSIGLFLLSINAYSQDTHVGLWKGKDKGEVGYLNFDNDGFAYLVMGKDTLGGREFVQNGIRAKMTYKFDYSSTPVSIDLIMSLLDTDKELGRLVGIVKFNSANEMVVRLTFSGTKRPKNFLPKDNADTIIFQRVK